MSRAAPTQPGVLAFLIADIRGYTAYTKDHGGEAAAHLAAVFAELGREGVEAHAGSVIELRGDELLATFSSPRQALRAAVALQAVFADEAATAPDLPLNVGVGIDAGEAVQVEAGYRGEALNFAARLCSVARAGEIVASESIRGLAGEVDGLRFEPTEELTLRGIAAPVRAWRVGRADARRQAQRERAGASVVPVDLDPLTSLFGRDVEARRLRWTWRLARTGAGSALVMTGPTGIGKTRLAAEAAIVASGDGGQILYASALGGGLGAVLDRLRDATSPTLIVLDDLESATDEELAAIRSNRTDIGRSPALVVALANDHARPEAAALLGSLALRDDQIRLGPIDQSAVAAIVETYSHGQGEPTPALAIAQASGGVPARVHELAADWARDQAARRLGAAVARTVDGRRDLRELESEVASNVIDLQAAQTRRGASRMPGADGDKCPFMGLISFDVADADRFFGRERLVAEMVGRLAGANFLGVVGPSGSGKSSAVRAGLVPALANGALPGAEHWTAVIMRPGGHPMRELDRVLYATVPADVRGRLSQAGTADGQDDPLVAAAAVLPPDRRPFVLVDQFEELFTTTTDDAERDGFVAQLVRAADGGYATVVIALRADFYGRCATYPRLAELLGSSHLLVGPMSRQEYVRAIEGPARRAGLAIDPALVDALVLEVVDEPGALPVLSTALVELWERREGRAIRLSAYAATGGVHGAVGRMAEAAYGRLDHVQQQIARGLFLRLAGGEGETVTRRRVPLAELEASNDSAVAAVIGSLTQSRLLTVGEGSIEVAHEALLREWPRLATWLEEDRAGRRVREHLTSATREWEAAGHDQAELYRGTRLAAAVDWTTDHTLELTETERSFLAESRRAETEDIERQRRTNRRLRVLLAVAGIALIAALGAGALALLQRAAAQEAATVADAQRLGAQALTQSNLDVSLLLARQGVALDDDSATRANLLSAIVRSPSAIGAWRPVPGRPLNIAVNLDGTRLLISNNSSEMYLVDAATGALLRDVGPGFGGFFAPDGSIVDMAPNGQGAKVTVSSVADGRTIREFDIPVGQNFTISPDASKIVQVDDDRRGIKILDSATGTMLGHLAAPPNVTVLDVWEYGAGAILAVDHVGLITNDADLGPAFDASAQVQLDYFASGASTPTASLTAGGGDGGSWALDPATSEIAVPQPDGTIAVYDLPSGKRRDFTLRHNGLIGMSFSPDGKTLVTAGDDRLMQVWDATSGTLRETLAGHTGRVFAPAMSTAGGHLTAWSVGLDSQLVEWDLTGDRRIDRPYYVGSGAKINGREMAVSPDGRLFAVPATDGTVDVLDAHTLVTVTRLSAIPGGDALAVAFSPDSRTLAVGGQGQPLVQRFDTTTWAPVGSALTGPPSTVPVTDPNAPPGTPPGPNAARALAWSADGSKLAAGTDDGGVYVWDLAGAADNPAVYSPGGPIAAVAFSPDGSKLAANYTARAAPTGGKSAVWTLADGVKQYVVSVDDDYGAPFSVTFTHDGKLLVTGGGIGEVRFWDAATGAQNGRAVLANSGWVVSLAFTADDSVLVTAGSDGTVRMIDPVGRHQLGSPLPGGDVNSIATLAPEGRVFVLYQNDGHGYVWDVSLPSLVSHACSVAGRTLTNLEWDQYLPGRPYSPACSPASAAASPSPSQ